MHVYVSICVYTLFYKIKKSTKIQIIIRFKFGSKNKKFRIYVKSLIYAIYIFYEGNMRRYERDRYIFPMRVMCEDMKEIDSWGIAI